MASEIIQKIYVKNKKHKTARFDVLYFDREMSDTIFAYKNSRTNKTHFITMKNNIPNFQYYNKYYLHIAEFFKNENFSNKQFLFEKKNIIQKYPEYFV